MVVIESMWRVYDRRFTVLAYSSIQIRGETKART